MEDMFVKDSLYAIKDKEGKLVGKMTFDGSKSNRLFFRQNGHICIVEKDAIGSATLIKSTAPFAGKCKSADVLFRNYLSRKQV